MKKLSTILVLFMFAFSVVVLPGCGGSGYEAGPDEAPTDAPEEDGGTVIFDESADGGGEQPGGADAN